MRQRFGMGGGQWIGSTLCLDGVWSPGAAQTEWGLWGSGWCAAALGAGDGVWQGGPLVSRQKVSCEGKSEVEGGTKLV